MRSRGSPTNHSTNQNSQQELKEDGQWKKRIYFRQRLRHSLSVDSAIAKAAIQTRRPTHTRPHVHPYMPYIYIYTHIYTYIHTYICDTRIDDPKPDQRRVLPVIVDINDISGIIKNIATQRKGITFRSRFARKRRELRRCPREMKGDAKMSCSGYV